MGAPGKVLGRVVAGVFGATGVLVRQGDRVDGGERTLSLGVEQTCQRGVLVCKQQLAEVRFAVAHVCGALRGLSMLLSRLFLPACLVTHCTDCCCCFAAAALVLSAARLCAASASLWSPSLASSSSNRRVMRTTHSSTSASSSTNTSSSSSSVQVSRYAWKLLHPSAATQLVLHCLEAPARKLSL